MPNVAVNEDSIVVSPYTTSPAKVSSSQSFVNITNTGGSAKPILLHGDSVASHSHDGTTHNSTAVATQSFFKIGGKNVVLGGDGATCSHEVIPPPPPGEAPTHTTITGTGFVIVTPLPPP